MQGAPDYKCPGGAVPQAADEEHQHDVKQPFCQRNAVAAEGDIDIIFEPTCERNMPATPEISDGAGGIGAVEILREVEAEDARRADGDIGIPREIAENLECEEHGGNSKAGTAVFSGIIINCINYDCSAIGNHDFLEHAPGGKAQAACNAVVIEFMLDFELREQRGRALDWAGD